MKRLPSLGRPGTLWAQGDVPQILPGHSGSRLLPRGRFQGQLHMTVISRCCWQMHSPWVGISFPAVLRPPLPFASVSLGPWGAVACWCHEPPRPPCCWRCLIRRGTLPVCFLSPSCLRVGLGTASLPASLSPAVILSCYSICPVRHPRPSPAALPAPPTPAPSWPPDLASPSVRVWQSRSQPHPSQPHPDACSLPCSAPAS